MLIGVLGSKDMSLAHLPCARIGSLLGNNYINDVQVVQG